MKLVEQHILKPTPELYELCFESKNLYNSCLYIARQYFFENGKYIGFSSLYKEIKKEEIWEKCGLKKKICNQVIKLVDQNYRAFFASIKSYNKSKVGFTGPPKIPKYKDTEKGQQVVIFEKGAISKKEFGKNGVISLSGTTLKIPTNIEEWGDVKQARIIPRANHFVVEIVYEVVEEELRSEANTASIDIGLSNLATVVFEDGASPLIFNGNPLKSINQYFNKKKSTIQAELETKNNKKWSRKLQKLQDKRNRKIKDYMHKISAKIINHLDSNDVSLLIIGKNKGWKQEINLGKRTNQNFVQIPFDTFISMLTYKCKLVGIEVRLQEESYTSKCSFLDLEKN